MVLRVGHRHVGPGGPCWSDRPIQATPCASGNVRGTRHGRGEPKVADCIGGRCIGCHGLAINDGTYLAGAAGPGTPGLPIHGLTTRKGPELLKRVRNRAFPAGGSAADIPIEASPATTRCSACPATVVYVYPII